MKTRRCILPYVALVIASMSCAPRYQHMRERGNGAGTPSARSVKSEFAALVRKGNYAEAIEIAGEAGKRPEAALQKSALYMAALDGLAEQGVNYYNDGDFKRAGIAFERVIEHMPAGGAEKYDFKYSRDHIRSLMHTCAERMMQQGLREYRDGNLGDAISIWKDILKFDPDHAEAKKALATASVQLKNLQKIESE